MCEDFLDNQRKSSCIYATKSAKLMFFMRWRDQFVEICC